MATAITKKIVGFRVAEHNDQAPAKPARSENLACETTVPSVMGEEMERPHVITGATYRIKSPVAEHAFYVTINDMVLNVGTPDEQRHPFEMFVNSKNMEQFQWIVALTRVVSAIFRKGGDVTFLVDELKAVFDPRGGYFKPGGIFVHSLVAEIGMVLEQHLTAIGLLKAPELSDSQRQLIAAKRTEYEHRLAPDTSATTSPSRAHDVANDTDGACGAEFPPGATECPKCRAMALVHLDNCDTCLQCAYSKCN